MHTPTPRGSCPPFASRPAPAVGCSHSLGLRSRGLRSLGVFLGVLFGVLALLSAGVRPACAASFLVTTLADDGSAGSLRAAITSANAANANGGSTITFATGLSGTIFLASGLPALAVDMTIQGSGASVIAVDERAAQPLFVNGGVTAMLSGLTIQNGSNSIGGGSGSGSGGGIYNAGTLTLTGCTLAGNRTSRGVGAGVYNDFGGTLTLTGCTLAGNSAQNNGGGVENVGALTLTACTLTQNSALDGGGVFNNGSVTLTRCALAGNSGGYGGGVENESGTLTLIGCTLTGNSTPNGFGGGIYNYNGTVTLAGCTLTGNSANNGGGIYNNSGTVTLTDAILYGDAPSGNEVSGPATATYCDIQGGYAGTGNLNADPRLAPLGSYGGPTQTCALLPGSPCLGAGTNAGLTTDQRGVPVPQNGRYDIGAFESRGFTVTGGSGSGGTGGSGQAAPVGTAFAQSLTATVTANAFSEPVAGGLLTFTGPASGASATFSPDPAPIGGTGAASVTATANGTAGGPYPVIADTGAGSALYFLTNFSPSTAPAITLQPRDVTVTAGTTATFTAAASGNPTPTVQWQVSTDGGTSFAVIVGATNTTYSFTASAAQNGSQYRAVFTNSAGSATTSAATLTVSPGAAARFSAAAPPTATAGTPVTVTFRALDAFGSLATTYNRTVRFTSTDPQAGGVPATVTFAGGVGSVSVTFKTAGAQTVTGTDTTSSALTATTGAIAVSAGPAAALHLTAPAGATAGQPFQATVTATDAYGNPTGATGTVSFASTDARAVLPAPVALAGGTATVAVTDATAGTQTLTASASGLTSGTAATLVASDPSGVPNVSVTGVTLTRTGPSTVTVSFTLVNTGAGEADAVRMTAARLNSVNAVSLPGPFTIGAGQSLPVSLTFTGVPAGPGSLTLGGTYTSVAATSYAFSSGKKVTVP